MTSKDSRIYRQQNRIRELEQMNDALKLKIHELKELNDSQWSQIQHMETIITMYEKERNTNGKGNRPVHRA